MTTDTICRVYVTTHALERWRERVGPGDAHAVLDAVRAARPATEAELTRWRRDGREPLLVHDGLGVAFVVSDRRRPGKSKDPPGVYRVATVLRCDGMVSTRLDL